MRERGRPPLRRYEKGQRRVRRFVPWRSVLLRTSFALLSMCPLTLQRWCEHPRTEDHRVGSRSSIYIEGRGAFILVCGRRRARRRGTIRTSNMNPKNIGSYAEGEGEEERHGLKAKAGSRKKKHEANVTEERI